MKKHFIRTETVLLPFLLAVTLACSPARASVPAEYTRESRTIMVMTPRHGHGLPTLPFSNVWSRGEEARAADFHLVRFETLN